MKAATRRAEALAARLPPLLLAAERVAATVAAGLHGRRRVGEGESFWQFRPFATGDATARIDWRQSAKSHRTFVREAEWEAAQTCFLWRDASPSMRWHSALAPVEKAARAELLLLALAALLLRGGERVRLIDAAIPFSSGTAALAGLAEALEHAPEGAALPRARDPAFCPGRAHQRFSDAGRGGSRPARPLRGAAGTRHAAANPRPRRARSPL